MSKNNRPQENVYDNAFFNWLQCLLTLKLIPKEISKVEVSQVDLTAKAIVKIFDKKSLGDEIYHIFNPMLLNLIEVFSKENRLKIEETSLENFINTLLNTLPRYHHNEFVLKFLLRQGWLDSEDLLHMNSVTIRQDKTQMILKKIGFEWLPITFEAFQEYLRKTYKEETLL
jgi:surfactin family lipopeptide synthetase A